MWFSEEYPAVRGVLVIAEGGGNPVTIQEIQEAVMALFQVGANKISSQNEVKESNAWKN